MEFAGIPNPFPGFRELWRFFQSEKNASRRFLAPASSQNLRGWECLVAAADKVAQAQRGNEITIKPIAAGSIPNRNPDTKRSLNQTPQPLVLPSLATMQRLSSTFVVGCYQNLRQTS